MTRSLFLRIHDTIVEHDKYFVQKRNGAGQSGLSSLQKITAAMRMLTYGASTDVIDDYVRIDKSTSLESVKRFIRSIINIFGGNTFGHRLIKTLHACLRKVHNEVFLVCLGASTACTGHGRIVQPPVKKEGLKVVATRDFYSLRFPPPASPFCPKNTKSDLCIQEGREKGEKIRFIITASSFSRLLLLLPRQRGTLSRLLLLPPPRSPVPKRRPWHRSVLQSSCSSKIALATAAAIASAAARAEAEESSVIALEGVACEWSGDRRGACGRGRIDSSSKLAVTSSSNSNSSSLLPSMPPTPAGNLDRFIVSTTPVVPVQYCHKTSVRRWRSSDNGESCPYFDLKDLWESFKEWSVYGAGVPLILNGNGVAIYCTVARIRKWLQETPEASSNDEPVVFDSSIIPWWAWIKIYNLPEAELLNGWLLHLILC
ncbi:uncharacterized protein LOC109838620 [Asparagus officinalis]|uniref:uncharacterized protein LOC109838620 n=1 Tax=Asparagus officinalis TaxID=4686 RepID=UPI00098E2412|nr:uncharacterized protein LOC109838620 [Asparagus officinalis]